MYVDGTLNIFMLASDMIYFILWKTENNYCVLLFFFFSYSSILDAWP